MHNGLHFGKLANTKLVVCVCLNSDVANTVWTISQTISGTILRTIFGTFLRGNFGKLANTKLVVCVCLYSDVANASWGHSVDNFADNSWNNSEENFWDISWGQFRGLFLGQLRCCEHRGHSVVDASIWRLFLSFIHWIGSNNLIWTIKYDLLKKMF